MLRTYRAPGLVIVSALSGLILQSDGALIRAFSANNKFGEVFSNVSLVAAALLVSGCSIGAAGASLFAGKLCEEVGGLWVLRIAAVLWSAGSLGVFFSPENVYVVLCKVIKGFAVGLSSVASVVYVFDMLTGPHRAVAVGWAVLLGIAGSAVIFVCGVLLQRIVVPVDAFRFSLAAESGWGLFLMVSSIILPDSPRTLARRSEWLRATKTLERMGIRESETPLLSVPPLAAHLGQLFEQSAKWRFLCSVAVQVFARFSAACGSTHLLHYTLASCRLPDSTVEFFNGFYYVFSAFFTMVSMAILRKARRTEMLFFGFLLHTITFASMSAISYVFAIPSSRHIAFGSPFVIQHVPASAMLALTCFSFSVSSSLISVCSTVYAMELLPNHIRTQGISLALSAAWISDALVLACGTAFFELAPFTIFACLAVVAFTGTIFVVFAPETKVVSCLEGIPFPLSVLEPKAKDLDPTTYKAELESNVASSKGSDLSCDDATSVVVIKNNARRPSQRVKHPTAKEPTMKFDSDRPDAHSVRATSSIKSHSFKPVMATAKTSFSSDQGLRLVSNPQSLNTTTTISGMWSDVDDRSI